MLKSGQSSSLLMGVSWKAFGLYSDHGHMLGTEKRNSGTPAMYHSVKLRFSTSTGGGGWGEGVGSSLSQIVAMSTTQQRWEARIPPGSKDT